MKKLQHEVNKPSWYIQFLYALEQKKIPYQMEGFQKFNVIRITGHLAINLMDMVNDYSPEDLLSTQQVYKFQNIQLIQLWEDVWFRKPNQVLARIQSLLGANKRIHGRKTTVKRISKPIADQFLAENHLQGPVSSRYKLGLFLAEDLVAVSTFSNLRKMNYGDNYKSAELIRFAVKAGFSIAGGLSKLILAFKTAFEPQDIMTYSDNDWSTGEAYLKLGFKPTAGLSPQYFTLDQNFNRHLIKKDLDSTDLKVYNTGSSKFILTF